MLFRSDDFDFCGDTYETTDFENGAILTKNIDATKKFITSIEKRVKKEKSDTVKAFIWRGIEYSWIRDEFFSKYMISKYSSLYINLPIFDQWIKKMNDDGKYIKWNIALIDGENRKELWGFGDNEGVGKIERTRKRDVEHIDIGALRSGRDALADVEVSSLNENERKILTEVMKNGKDIVSKRSRLKLDDIPLLLIYCIKKDGGKDKIRRMKMDADSDIIGMSIIVSGDGIGGNHARSIRINIPDISEVEE